VVANLDPDAPPIWADSGLLEQVLFNLIENALRYSPPDAPVQVTVAHDPDSLTLTVVDEGSGIEKAELTRIFEKFHRGPQANLQTAGVGLGLAICHRIIVALGGTIEAESPVEKGRGTRIRICLPLPPDQAAPREI
jgi:two-component system sensor histidine kinase KdpD